MRVKDLIKQLNRVRDQDKHIYFYDQHHEIQEIYEIDELSDRVDLNCVVDEWEEPTQDDEAYTRWKLFTFFLLDPDEQGRLV